MINRFYIRSYIFFIGVLLIILGLFLGFKIYSEVPGWGVYFFSGFGLLVFSPVLLLCSKKKNSALVSGFVSSLAVFGILFFLFCLFWFFSSEFHTAEWLLFPLKCILLMVGIHSQIYDKKLIFNYDDFNFEFAVSYEQSAFWFFLMLLLCAIFYCLFLDIDNKQKVKLAIKLILSTMIYLLFRYCFLIITFSFFMNLDIFCSPFFITISIVPLCILFGYYFSNLPIKMITFNFSLKMILQLILVFCTIGMLIFASCLYNGGNKKNGVIYIDEYHGKNWEPIFEELNTENFYGQASTYTYYSFVKILEKFSDVKVITKTMDYTFVTPNDILIIKTPTVDFDARTIDKIHQFVENGGGLWLIGDHTNLMNMNYRLNSISRLYGATFNHDALYHLQTGNLTSFNNSLFPFCVHQIVQPVSHYDFATSCSIQSDLGFRAVITGNNLCSELEDLSHQNFFGDLSLSEEEYFGLFKQCVAGKVKKGRIVMYSDSTTFSSFSVFMGKNPEFIFSILNYLNYKNNFNYFYIVFLILLLLLILSFVRVRPFKKNDIVLLLMVFPFFLYILSTINNVYNFRHRNAVSKALNSVPSVFWWTDSGKLNLISDFDGSMNIYSSFFIAFQRMGYFMREVNTLHNTDFLNSELLVVSNITPKRIEEYPDILNYVTNGGKLLVLLSEADLNMKIDMLKRFNIYYSAFPVECLSDDLRVTREFSVNNMGLVNSRSLEFSSGIRLDKFEYGKNLGEIYVLLNAHKFDNMFLGSPTQVPTPIQIKQHKLLFQIINEIFEKGGNDERFNFKSG